MQKEVKLTINFNKIILSSESKCYKTSLFVKNTDFILSLDKLLVKLWENIIKNKDIIKSLNTETDCFEISVLDAKICFKFVNNHNLLQPNDIIFYSLTDSNNKKIQNENFFIQHLVNPQLIDFTISPQSPVIHNFEKLYCVYESDYINFPLLSEEQQNIVKTENQNVLVQGVAGSGKTNICISKIIYSACKGYKGKVLYTTYSRSLLLNIKEKIERYIYNLEQFYNNFKNNKIEFLDNNHKKAIENRLNIHFSQQEDKSIQYKLASVINFLNENVDFLMIEDIYKSFSDSEIKLADERYFIETYSKNIKNHNITVKFEKLKHLTSELIYKEIYGLILGSCNISNPQSILSLEEFKEKRKHSLNSVECECIYAIAKDYYEHLNENNLVDNNLICKKLLNKKQKHEIYSLSIIDEVQDLTEINLYYIKQISRKMFCVGDALQMVNPTYFSFAYLKRLMYEQDISTVAKLQNNYRNTKKLQSVIEKLNEINVKLFGHHNFVVAGKSIDSGITSLCVKVADNNFITQLKDKNYSGITIITNSLKEKNQLQNKLPKFEILSVSEIKGLERENIILYNIISSNNVKWKLFLNKNLSRKTADENSIFRYYFNLFYVALSRAKQNVFVVEDEDNAIFNNFFKLNFEQYSTEELIKIIEKNIPVFEINEKEVKHRISKFISLSQFDNARFLVNKLSNKTDQISQMSRIDIYEKYVSKEKYQEAGIKLWKLGFMEDAKKQFLFSHDYELVKLVNACEGNSGNISMNILPYYLKFKDNQMVLEIIQQAILEDIEKFEKRQKIIEKTFKRGDNNGKR